MKLQLKQEALKKIRYTRKSDVFITLSAIFSLTRKYSRYE